MALVNYSDSESDTEAPVIAPVVKAKPAVTATKSAFSTAQPGKIRVDLPSIKSTSTSEGAEQPPAKRARTGGAFSGFNSLLPAPKRAVQNAAPKRGVSLKTSSEAAFSRAPAPATADDHEDDRNYAPDIEATRLPPTEVKLIGKNTMFVPTSVTNKQKSSGKVAPTSSVASKQPISLRQDIPAAEKGTTDNKPIPKPKQSLFSFQAGDEAAPAAALTGHYEPLMIPEQQSSSTEANAGEEAQSFTATHTTQLAHSSSLLAVAADMNLTPAQRRQLFGRNAKNHENISVANFNIDSEYASNEALRQSGDVFQHRAVKSIAPGKHSLQQLVNNARSQKDAIEDAWAEGRRNRGEGGSKYGWTNG